MNNKKKGLTLVELMATLAISSIVIVMIGGVFVQGYKIANRTNNYAAIEDEFRNAMMNIEKNVSNADEFNTFGKGDTAAYEFIDSTTGKGTKGEKLVEVKKDAETILYAEMDTDIKNKKSQLWEIRKTSDTIKGTKKTEVRVLINEIDKNKGAEGIVVTKNTDGMINISMAGLTKGNEWRSNAYAGSIKTNNNKEIILNIDGGGTGNPGIPPIDDIVNGLGNYNIVVSGDVYVKPNGSIKPGDSSDKKNGSLGYSGELNTNADHGNGNGNKGDVTINNKQDSSINKIEFNGSKSNVTINSINYTNLEVSGGVPLAQEGFSTTEWPPRNATILLVNGDVDINVSNAQMLNTIIIATGRVTFANHSVVHMVNSIIYCNELYISNHAEIAVGNEDGMQYKPIGILSFESVRKKLGKLLNQYIKR